MSDFKVFTGLLKAQELDGRKVINATASSSVTDRHGDQMTPEAIQSMAAQAASSRMTIFLNHEYRVPEDVFGSVIAANAVSKQNNVWELQLGVEVDETNPRAVATYKMLRGKNDDGRGAKLGVSIGALIKNYELKDAKDLFSPMIIKDVELLEASIVGIPANPDSWVKQASKSIRKQLRDQQEAPESDATDKEPIVESGQPEDAEAPVVIEKAVEPDEDEAEEAAKTDEESDEAGEDGDRLTSDEADTHDALDETTKSIDEELPTSPVELSAEEQPVDAPETTTADPSAEELAVLAMTNKVVAMAAKLSDKDREIAELIKQRDDAVASLRLAMQFVERLARTPLGRKTSFATPISDFRSRFGQVYDDDFLAFLEKKNES